MDMNSINTPWYGNFHPFSHYGSCMVGNQHVGLFVYPSSSTYLPRITHFPLKTNALGLKRNYLFIFWVFWNTNAIFLYYAHNICSFPTRSTKKSMVLEKLSMTATWAHACISSSSFLQHPHFITLKFLAFGCIWACPRCSLIDYEVSRMIIFTLSKIPYFYIPLH